MKTSSSLVTVLLRRKEIISEEISPATGLPKSKIVSEMTPTAAMVWICTGKTSPAAAFVETSTAEEPSELMPSAGIVIDDPEMITLIDCLAVIAAVLAMVSEIVSEAKSHEPAENLPGGMDSSDSDCEGPPNVGRVTKTFSSGPIFIAGLKTKSMFSSLFPASGNGKAIAV